MVEEKQDDKKEDINKDELETCKQKMEEYLNGWKRAKADYINLKKENEKKQADLIQFATAGLILDLLPMIDNIKQAVKHIPEDNKKEDWVVGFLNIKKQFDDFLNNIEIEEIKTIDEKFNPEFHDAVTKKKVEGKEEGIIVEEVTGGYKMKDNVIVPAKVIVSE